MDSKRLFRQMGTALILAALAMSCAPGEDMENTEFLDPSKQLSSNLKGETLTYNGIWTVDGLEAETVNAYVKIDDTSEISFDSYPYQTIIQTMPFIWKTRRKSMTIRFFSVRQRYRSSSTRPTAAKPSSERSLPPIGLWPRLIITTTHSLWYCRYTA